MQVTGEQLAGYEAAHSGAAFRRVPEPGYVIVRGEHQQDFIQRQTTNDVRQLAPGRTQLTVLTSGTARVLDVWRLVPETDGIGIVTLAGHGAATARYLQGHIFFMDRVTLTDASAEYPQIEIFGPEAAGALAQIGVAEPPAPDHITEVEIGGEAARVLGPANGIGQGYLLLVPVGAAPALVDALAGAGAVEVAPDAAEVLRVESGLPGTARELSEDFTPLEANLDAAISMTKGCYTGQEIIARQINYDKVTRRLVGVRIAEPVAVGAAVQVEGRTAGEVTSVARSPRFGWLALAMVKRPHFAPGTSVSLAGEAGPVPGTVAALPFENDA